MEYSPENDQLTGWKEIAAYLRKSTRAVQRWERDIGLPVHRVRTPSGQSIYARRSEIEAWLKSAEPARPPRPASAPAASRHRLRALLDFRGLANRAATASHDLPALSFLRASHPNAMAWQAFASPAVIGAGLAIVAAFTLWWLR